MTRVALIPGGARGIGRAIACALGARGWDVAICYRTNHSDAESLTATVAGAGGAALALACDVSTPQACAEAYASVIAWRGRVDALIYCAGPFHRIDLLSETPEDWRSTFAANLDGLFYLSRLVAPGMMLRRWGRIIACATANADRLMAQTQITAHYLAKVALLGLIRSLAKALAPSQITANAISPGFIATGSAEMADLPQLTRTIPAGRIGSVDDVVGAALYLLAEEAGYVNGTNLHVSGGWGI
ncbi:MAG: SDR family oxidoreductase [Polyangia bacterium]|jgi:NAD(P)-dependent dehydrogenase (short-subunit alcohol dehydrogenase family)